MLFTTIPFWATFIGFILVYALLRKYTRLGMMIYVVAFSLFFFYLANQWLMLVLPLTAIASWLFTRHMSAVEGRERKVWVTMIILLNLVPLIYYKYTNFSIEVINDMLNTNFSLRSIALPIGISFYTFQAISHTVDVYRRKFTTQVTLIEYLFYLSFFPLLLAGPITRAETFFPQIRRRGAVPERLLYTGVWLIVLGLLKKAVIADYIAQFNNWIFDDPQTYSGYECAMGMIGYSVQIYCDFSGYSDLSIGLAALMGIRLKDNFRFPYQSVNLTEFWRRWHISLSTWFRDYLYIPMGGNRKGKFMTYFNNFVTMLVAGLWHGSTWMFVIWGAIHGLGLVVHKALRPLLDRIPDTLPVRIICCMLTFVYVTIAWTFFRADSVDTCMQIFARVATDFSLDYVVPFFTARTEWCVMVLIAIGVFALRERHYTRLQTLFIRTPWIVKLLIFMVCVQLVIQYHSSSVQPFIYYQF